MKTLFLNFICLGGILYFLVCCTIWHCFFSLSSPGHSPKGSTLLLKKDAEADEDAGAVGGAKERRRHSSAPDENKGESKDDSHVASKSSQPLLSVTTMPRTRSTTSLQSLLQEDASPSVQPHEVKSRAVIDIHFIRFDYWHYFFQFQDSNYFNSIFKNCTKHEKFVNFRGITLYFYPPFNPRR